MFGMLADKTLGKFLKCHRGSIAINFALVGGLLIAAGGGAVDISRAVNAKSNLRAALDTAALSLVSNPESESDVQATARTWFDASYGNMSLGAVDIDAQYNQETKVATVSGTTQIETTLLKVIGLDTIEVAATSTAALSGGKQYQVCVLITSPDENHTLLGKDGAEIDFHNCLVQVDTENWDAVEMRDSSYLHSVDGENCFVGDIHYGDVQPGKSPTCTFFGDPFADYEIPDTTCDFTNYVVNSVSTLSPATYCGGLTINASVTLSPGVYTIRDGKLHVTGNSTNVTANNVTFLITGNNAGLDINTAGTFTISPASDAVAGKFGGFAFYVDASSSNSGNNSGSKWGKKGGKKGNSKSGSSKIRKVTMNASGIFYFAGQKLEIENGADVTINPGSIIADFLLPKNASLDLTGTLNSSNAALSNLQKQGYGTGTPVLIN